MTTTTETTKLSRVADERSTILDFLEWLSGKGIRLVSEQTVTDTHIDWTRPGSEPHDFETTKDLLHPIQGQDLVHEYLEIDEAALERERRAALAGLQEDGDLR